MATGKLETSEALANRTDLTTCVTSDSQRPMLKPVAIFSLAVVLFGGSAFAQYEWAPPVLPTLETIPGGVPCIQTSLNAREGGMEDLLAYLNREVDAFEGDFCRLDRHDEVGFTPTGKTSFGASFGGMSVSALASAFEKELPYARQISNAAVVIVLGGFIVGMTDAIIRNAKYDDLSIFLFDSCGTKRKWIMVRDLPEDQVAGVISLVRQAARENGLKPYGAGE